MTWQDYCKFAINKYPPLFARKTWEDSCFQVAHQCFCVLGNGLEWAENKGVQLGYLVSPKSHKVRGEWVRNIDKPYGKEKFKGDSLYILKKVKK